MNKPRFLDRRVGFSVGALGFLLAMVAPALLTGFASAAQITTRSVTMSSSSPSATSNYEIQFTPVTTGAADMDILFCDNTPLSGNSCTQPTGLSLTSATVSGDGAAYDTVDSPNPGGASNNEVGLKTVTLTTGSNAITLTGVTNPSTSDHTFYVRIETFTGGSALANAESEFTADGTSMTGLTDNGSVALSTSNALGVQAAVLESLSFCTFGDPGNDTATTSGSANSSSYLSGLTTGAHGPATGCDDSSNDVDGSPPSTAITLGNQVATGVLALEDTAASYGAGWTQLSTNANGGALVYLQNYNNACAGLTLNGGTSCTATDSIGAPDSGNGGGTMTGNGTAAFGFTFGGGSTPGALSDGTTPTGSVDINSNYKTDYALLTTATTSASQSNAAEDGLVQNVDSTYGGFVYGTEGAPATDQDVPFGMAAQVANDTAAGTYKGSYGLTAVGTF